MNKNLRKAVHDKCNGKCAYCGDPLGKKWTVDHVIPQRNYIQFVHNQWRVPPFLAHLTEFDMNSIDNLLPSCSSCNNYKSSMDLETFRDELGKLVERLQKTVTIFKISIRFGLLTKHKKKIVFYFERLKIYDNRNTSIS